MLIQIGIGILFFMVGCIVVEPSDIHPLAATFGSGFLAYVAVAIILPMYAPLASQLFTIGIIAGCMTVGAIIGRAIKKNLTKVQ